MLDKLNDDSLRNIMYNLDIKTYFILTGVSKRFNEMVKNEETLKTFANFVYSKKFWIRAHKRPIQISRPYISYYYELQRIGKFEVNNSVTEEYYYNLWDLIDN